jgi:hypothetical protein
VKRMISAMIARLAAVSFLVLASWAAVAQDQAFTNRSTDLKEKAAMDARTVATLPENTSVRVIGRGGQWTQVEAQAQRGWVRVFHLRFPSAVETSSGSGGGAFSSLTGALGFGRQNQRTATVATTGIRGLTAEDFANASPDTEALKRLQSWRADRPAAERFARDGKLAAQNVDYSEGRR